MIAGTEADCRILDTDVSGTTAYIRCLVFSHKRATETKGFRFWIVDSDGSAVYADECVYWLDGVGQYSNDAKSVDVNQYREILLKVDITKGGNANLSGNRWVRRIYVGIRDVNAPESDDLLWKSGTIDLVSSPFETPRIAGIGFRKRDGTAYVRFRNEYSPQADFSISNANTFTRISVTDIATGEELESHEVYVGDGQTTIRSFENAEVYRRDYGGIVDETYPDERIRKTIETETALQNAASGEIEIPLLNEYDNIVKIRFQTLNAKGEFLGGTARYVDMAMSASRLFVRKNKRIAEAESVSAISEGKPRTSITMPYMKPFSFPAPYIILQPDGQHFAILFENGYYDEVRVDVYVGNVFVTSTTQSGQLIKTNRLFLDPKTADMPTTVSISDFALNDVTIRTTYVKGAYIKIIEERRPLASMVAVCSEYVLCSPYLLPLTWDTDHVDIAQN